MDLDFLFQAPTAPAVVTFGKVTSTSPLKVQFNGTDSTSAVQGVKRLSTYTPALNDVVQLVKVGAVWVIQGAIV